MGNISELLEPIASWFRSLGMPDLVVQWGHPLMMAIVVFVVGSFVGVAGWRGRIAQDKEQAAKSWGGHRMMAPWLFLFIAAGYTGGLLSLAVQQQPILESPHFWTGSVVLLLLGANGTLSLGNFAGDRATLRTIHAYIGSAALCLLFLHALLGLKLGLSI